MNVSNAGLLAIALGYLIFGLFSKTSRWGAFTASGYFLGGAVLVHYFRGNVGLLLGWTVLAVVVWFAGVWRMKNPVPNEPVDVARARKVMVFQFIVPLILTATFALLDREHWLAYIMLGVITSLGALRSHLVTVRSSRSQRRILI